MIFTWRGKRIGQSLSIAPSLVLLFALQCCNASLLESDQHQNVQCDGKLAKCKTQCVTKWRWCEWSCVRLVVSAVQCAMFNVQCAMFNVQCAMCNLQCAMCNVQCAICNVQSAMCNVQCSMCNVQCAMCNVQCAMCNVQCAMCNQCENYKVKLCQSGGVCAVQGRGGRSRPVTWLANVPRDKGRAGVKHTAIIHTLNLLFTKRNCTKGKSGNAKGQVYEIYGNRNQKTFKK